MNGRAALGARRGAVSGGSSPQSGTVLMLFPAAVFVVCVLGALAVDSANVVMHRRDLQHVADAAANDAAALSLDSTALRQGQVIIDAELAQATAETSIAAQDVRGITSVTVTVEDDNTVVVSLEASHPSVFARSIPGATDHFDVRATARAQAVTAGVDPSSR